jgi:hypothetical protein
VERKSGSSVYWIVGGVLAALVCCLCLVLTLGVSTVLGAQWFSRLEVRPSPPSITPGPTPTPWVLLSTPVPIPQQALDTEKLLAEVNVPTADPLLLAERLQGAVNPPRIVSDHAAPIALGTTQMFWASNTDTNEQFQVTARLAYATPHVYFWVEDGVRYSQASIQRLVDRFETKTYPTDRAFFGSEWTPGVDGDVHLYVLYASGLGSSVAGYFSSVDEYSPLVHKYSNGHEMFDLNADALNLASPFADSTMAHEFQHMIHWNLDRNEESWMNEGFSVLAELLNGYDVGGDDTAYAAAPDIPLTYWPSPPDPAHYGQAFLFLAYFLDRFGEQATKALVANQANGLDSVDQTLASLHETDPQTGKPVTTDDLYRDWAAAVTLEDRSVADGRYEVKSDPSAPRIAFSDRVRQCPLPELDRTVAQYGIDAIDIRCSGHYTLSFDGQSLAKVVPADPHSGSFDLWSNRGDESDMTLTREFDLTNAHAPIVMDYSAWYDIEKDYDYLYVEVSDDNGQTWHILKTPSGTDTNPSGNSYGWGYTGMSGGGVNATWIDEQVDLSGYAGKDIQVRFEYVTDAAVNGEGLLLDDVAIPAVAYQADFEDGNDGWAAEGFVRLYNRVPQTYQVALIEEGSQTTVQDIALDENEHAAIDLDLGNGVNEAILVVVGTTRHTWQAAPYRVTVSTR